MEYKFQVNLRGIIDLLSNHLYSSPQVYVRELLQNGVDAIRARQLHDAEHAGELQIELITPSQPGSRPTLIFQDNGIGLTREEIHQFLATIGESSKREQADSFLGQFGIGLLSCFIVCDEIVLITRSTAADSVTLEWSGRPDGTYTLKELPRETAPGTQVFLRCKPGSEEYFEPARVTALLSEYGGFLPVPIHFTHNAQTQQLNPDGVPWRRNFRSPQARRNALLEWARNTFGQQFFDVIPLQSKVGEVDGVALVLPFSPNVASKVKHRVYLKQMLLSDAAADLLPEWAFFVKCVINANDLRPNAARESFFEDDRLATVRMQLGETLRAYLIHLANDDPQRLKGLIDLHYLSLKMLAVQDVSFCELFIDFLPFETTLGRVPFGQLRKSGELVRYTNRVDEYRELAAVAAAQGWTVINGGYVHDAELLAKASLIFPDLTLEQVESAEVLDHLEDLTLAERENIEPFLAAAEEALEPFQCTAEIRKFRPSDLPTLFGSNSDTRFYRAMEQSRQIADGLWSGMLQNVSGGHQPQSQLCFNFHNPMVRNLTTVRDAALLRRSIELLYVQALLLGHHPLQAREMRLLNEGLLALIQWGVERNTP